MKKIMKFSALVALMAIVICTQSACDKGLLPQISFKTEAGYTSTNVTVAKGAKVKVGIKAAKSEDKDVLKPSMCPTNMMERPAPPPLKMKP